VKPIKILELGMTATVGGVETYLLNQLRCFDASKIHCDYINDKNYDKLAYEDDFIALGAGIVRIQSNFSKNYLAFCKEFKKMLLANNYDVIIANAAVYSWKQAVELKIAKKVGVPVRILHSHASGQKLSMKAHVGRLFERPFCEKKGSILTQRWACSKDAGRFFFNKQPFEVINNGIDTDAYTFNEAIRDKVRKEMHVASDTLVLGNVGRITYAKNQSFLIPVVATLHEQGIPLQLWLVGPVQQGDDEEIKKVKQAIEEHHAEDYVKLLGMRRDVQNLMMAMDVFLLPSQYEGLGIVAIEAQCSGLPCVLSNRVPLKAKLAENVEFVPINQSVRLWVDAIKQRNASESRNNGAEIVRTNGFSIQEETKRVEQLLEGFFQKDTK
jgi:glycosyltransferase EpsF